MYTPAGQSLHALPPALSRNSPAAHRLHRVAPSVALNSPREHSRHVLAPAVLEYVPARQDRQTSTALSFIQLNRNPARQTHPDKLAPASESELAGHCVHELWPSPL